MKKIILLSLILGLLLSACQKAEEMKYIGATSVVFGTTSDTLKYIVYSFLEHPEVLTLDTIYIPVRIQGNRASYDRTIKVSVVTTNTTATVGINYEALKAQYIMPADSGSIQLPVIIKKGDSRLNIAPVKIALQIQPNEDFISNPKMQNTIVTFSNTIKEPVWWDFWYRYQSDFPKFSVTAYSLVTKITRRTSFATTSAGNTSEFYISVYSMLNVWSPFFTAVTSGVQTLTTWIGNHPGWLLVKHTNDADYDFYQSSDPSAKFRYGVVSSGSTIYGIFDENGNVVAK